MYLNVEDMFICETRLQKIAKTQFSSLHMRHDVITIWRQTCHARRDVQAL